MEIWGSNPDHVDQNHMCYHYTNLQHAPEINDPGGLTLASLSLVKHFFHDPYLCISRRSRTVHLGFGGQEKIPSLEIYLVPRGEIESPHSRLLEPRSLPIGVPRHCWVRIPESHRGLMVMSHRCYYYTNPL